MKGALHETEAVIVTRGYLKRLQDPLNTPSHVSSPRYKEGTKSKKADMPKSQQTARAEIKDPAVLTLNSRQLPASRINVC